MDTTSHRLYHMHIQARTYSFPSPFLGLLLEGGLAFRLYGYPQSGFRLNGTAGTMLRCVVLFVWQGTIVNHP